MENFDVLRFDNFFLAPKISHLRDHAMIWQIFDAFEATDVKEAQAKGCVNLSNKFR